MSKKTKKNSKKTSNTSLLIAIIVVAVTLILVLIGILLFSDWNKMPAGPQGTDSPETTANAGESDTISPGDVTVEWQEEQLIFLHDSLQITRIGSYAGLYMEDGSNEVVSDVMMIILENTSAQDLQLARIHVIYADFTAEFEVTNLPAGASAVLLEKNRHALPTEDYARLESQDVVFFQESMNVHEDIFAVSGQPGVINIQNITDQDLTSDIYIYYKNSSDDLLYGGITYRAKVSGGIAAGQMVQVTTGHYSPDTCTILDITGGE